MPNYKPNVDTSKLEIINNTPTKCSKVNKKLTEDVTRTSQINESPIIKKHVPGIYFLTCSPFN